MFEKVLFLVIPAFFLFIFIEYFVSIKMNKLFYQNFEDSLSSLFSGMASVVFRSLNISIIFIGYEFMVNKYSVTQLPIENPLTWVFHFLVLDFAGYWMHRLSHSVNFFWGMHIVHHNSQEFNLTTALRQPTSAALFNYQALFLLPSVVLGVPVEVVLTVGVVHIYYQFWYHTQFIKSMGWLEKIIITPSSHRVHHAVNPEYINKNYGLVLVLWDKWFGTYMKEQDSTSPKYGITYPTKTYNPIKVDFIHWFLLLKDSVVYSKGFDRIKFWFSPTNSRPKDAFHNSPWNKINLNSNYQKFSPEVDGFLKLWTLFQLVSLGLISGAWLSLNPGEFNSGWVLIGLTILLSIYTSTERISNNLNVVSIHIIQMLSLGGAVHFGFPFDISYLYIALLLIGIDIVVTFVLKIRSSSSVGRAKD